MFMSVYGGWDATDILMSVYGGMQRSYSYVLGGWDPSAESDGSDPEQVTQCIDLA
jgi:hypothetical protein